MTTEVSREVVLQRLTLVFRDVFDDDHLSISDRTSPKDLMDWDSLNHLKLIAAIEKEFSVKFPVKELARFTSVRDFADSILQKQA